MAANLVYRMILSLFLATSPAHENAGTALLREKLQQLDRQAQPIKNLTADFTEEKFTTLLRKPLVSQGHIFVKGKKTRWHTTTPQESTLFTDESRVAIYFPSRATMEVYPVDRRLRALIVSPVPRVATLQQHFHIELTPGQSPRKLNLRLTPKDDSLKEFVEEIRVTVDLTLGLATRIEMFDPEGDRTVITFNRVHTNVNLTDEDVAYQLPAGTKVVHPLDSPPQRSGATPLHKP